MSEPYEPGGIRFYDQRSGRDMILVNEGPYAGWLCCRYPEGQWVTLRKATDHDIDRLRQAIKAAPGGG